MIEWEEGNFSEFFDEGERLSITFRGDGLVSVVLMIGPEEDDEMEALLSVEKIRELSQWLNKVFAKEIGDE